MPLQGNRPTNLSYKFLFSVAHFYRRHKTVVRVYLNDLQSKRKHIFVACRLYCLQSFIKCLKEYHVYGPCERVMGVMLFTYF